MLTIIKDKPKISSHSLLIAKNQETKEIFVFSDLLIYCGWRYDARCELNYLDSFKIELYAFLCVCVQ